MVNNFQFRTSISCLYNEYLIEKGESKDQATCNSEWSPWSGARGTGFLHGPRHAYWPLMSSMRPPCGNPFPLGISSQVWSYWSHGIHSPGK